MAEPQSLDVPANGYLVVRASGAAAARAAILGGRKDPEDVQLLLRCPVPRVGRDSESGAKLTFADATLHLQPSGVVMLTVAAAKLSISFAELRPLMFRPVEVDAPLRALFAGAVAHVVAAGPRLDPHGLAHHLLGLAELVLRSALRVELDRVDALAARRREALEYMRAHLGEQSLGADKIAEALYISRRRLYQLFDDGQGVSERLKGLRVERAKALLADPAKAGRGIAEIARDCGFTSAPHFSRTFRRATGRTPREFRERALRG
ncbi:helix-turn-helix transcriptional regulator [Amycolatopsis sp. CA-126428]|uniref:helix-turn-helix transcriptional regulator n=1 Tax=Amycolatopsis sp. CA-126428 TaxID=2073158 RepID=UPI000CD2D2EB|nr:helix-turn-helix transcriptional regulator [Amycolatopsis sp. CA-126428]